MKNISITNIYQWPKTTQFLVLGLIFAGAFYLGYWFDLSNLKIDLDDAQQQETTLKQQLEIVINNQAKLENELKQFPTLKAQLLNWKKKIINYDDLPQLLNQILAAGANNHLYFSLFTPGASMQESPFAKVPIKVIVVGNYHQIASFISQLANLPQITVVRDFEISNENKEATLGKKLAEQANTQNLLSATLTLEVYHFPEKSVEKPKVGT